MTDYRDVINRIKPSIAFIVAQNTDGHFEQGTGFVYGKKGVLVTCNHVIKDASDIIIRFSDMPKDEYIPAHASMKDEDHDLALLTFDENNREPLQPGNETEVVEGLPVLIAGYPLNISHFTAHQGMISGITEDKAGATVFMIDGTINIGNSGGPLMNQNGLVIGVIHAKRKERSELLDKVDIMELGALSIHGADMVEIYQALIRNLQLGIGYAVPGNYIPNKK